MHVPVLHGDHVAFFLTRLLLFGDQIGPNDVQLPNGQSPSMGALIVCGTCGHEFAWERAILDAQQQLHYEGHA